MKPSGVTCNAAGEFMFDAVDVIADGGTITFDEGLAEESLTLTSGQLSIRCLVV